MMNHQITQQGNLLTHDGELREPGWAKQLILNYNREDIRANRLRLKEWDYYIMIHPEDRFALALCVADNQYMGLINASFYDFKRQQKTDHLIPFVFPLGKFNMPRSSESGDFEYHHFGCDFEYLVAPGERRLRCKYPKGIFSPHVFEADIHLTQPQSDTMVIATPWKEDCHAFYYNQKINCMPADGYCVMGGRKFLFRPDRHFGTLDWGRGVWTYDNTWYWGSASGYVQGNAVGFNIGYGFGDTSAASENMVFVNGKCHKLCQVTFHIPEGDIMRPWTFTSDDGRFEMDFDPVFDNKTDLDAVIISQHANQVFGYYSGDIVLDDGNVLSVDHLLGFAECVHNKY